MLDAKKQMISGPNWHHSEENGPWQGWTNLLLWLCYNCPGSKSRIHSFAWKKFKPCIDRGISISCLFTLLSLCLKIFKVLVSNQFQSLTPDCFCFLAWIHVAMDIQTEMSTTPFSTFWNLGLCALHSVQLICNWEFKVCSVCLIGCLFYRRRGAKVIFSWLGSILFAGSVLAHCFNNQDRS